jgi:hypothetical protein
VVVDQAAGGLLADEPVIPAHTIGATGGLPPLNLVLRGKREIHGAQDDTPDAARLWRTRFR